MIKITNIHSKAMVRLICDLAESRVAGFIAYDERHPYVVNVLKQPHFWEAINRISGERWPIFGVKPEDIHSIAKNLNEASFRVSEKLFYDLFGGNDGNLEFPCFIVFKWQDNGELTWNSYPLSDRSENDAYNSIIKIVNEINDIEKHILPEYRRGEQVYQNAVIGLRQMFLQNKIKSFLPEIISLAIKLVGGNDNS